MSMRERNRMTEAVLVTSRDLRESANLACWPAQRDLETCLTQAFADQGVTLRRGFPMSETTGHGFNSNQRMGMDIFAGIDPEANLVFATAAWQYTRHVLPGMRSHRGPILTVANRAMAGSGRPAQSEWKPGKGGHSVRHALERAVRRCFFSGRFERVDRGEEGHARSVTRSTV